MTGMMGNVVGVRLKKTMSIIWTLTLSSIRFYMCVCCVLKPFFLYKTCIQLVQVQTELPTERLHVLTWYFAVSQYISPTQWLFKVLSLYPTLSLMLYTQIIRNEKLMAATWYLWILLTEYTHTHTHKKHTNMHTQTSSCAEVEPPCRLCFCGNSR